jgi:hypothetical protein
VLPGEILDSAPVTVQQLSILYQWLPKKVIQASPKGDPRAHEIARLFRYVLKNSGLSPGAVIVAVVPLCGLEMNGD